MKRGQVLVLVGCLPLLSLFLPGLVPSLPGAEEAAPDPAPETAQTDVLGPLTNQVEEQEIITADRAWRSFLQVQGQLDTALLTLERNRRESEAIALDNQKKINESLKSIEKVMQAQQEREIITLRESNRNMLIVAGAFAGVGFMAMLLTSFFHLRSMNRLASIATTFPLAHAYGAGAAGLLSAEDERVLASGPAVSAGHRLLHAIEKLEKRVVDLEHTSHLPRDSQATAATVEADLHPAVAESSQQTELPQPDQRMSSLVGKGQSLLSLGKAEEALICFDQALDLQPDHAETLVKKGTALEKLNRLDEAIECYDQAIAVNNSMTLAYLFKGGLFNRMERYNEALACYELALKTQQHPLPTAPA